MVGWMGLGYIRIEYLITIKHIRRLARWANKFMQNQLNRSDYYYYYLFAPNGARMLFILHKSHLILPLLLPYNFISCVYGERIENCHSLNSENNHMCHTPRWIYWALGMSEIRFLNWYHQYYYESYNYTVQHHTYRQIWSIKWVNGYRCHQQQCHKKNNFLYVLDKEPMCSLIYW